MVDQAGRYLFVEVDGLGPDTFGLEGIVGTEELSRPYAYELELHSEDHGLSPRNVVGKAVSFRVRPDGADEKLLHGHVRAFAAGDTHASGTRRYRATVVPWLWFLSKRSDCRIFQNQSVPEIVEAVFADAGFSDYSLSSVQGSHPKREYCVQYRESDLSFVSRLLEEEGIFYFFEHEESRHVLALCDRKLAFKNCDENQVVFTAGGLAEPHVSQWVHRFEFVSGKWAHDDYNFETPKSDLAAEETTRLDLADATKFELYDYPGRYAKRADGSQLARVRLEAEEVGYETLDLSGTCMSFRVGGKFNVKECDNEGEAGAAYAIASVRHRASDTSYDASVRAQRSYSNSCTCVAADLEFRPARLTPRPTIPGPQTAVVVGPDGEEIYTDEHGRIKVQFHWDREGKSDEKSSCWIRVAQSWAGKGWGSVFLPRIGQEVVVAFLEGDPDRPLVTGSVYNAVQTPPYDLPANRTQSGFKSRSAKGAGSSNFNEIRLEDKKGSEQLYVHAEKDQAVVVENDQAIEIGHDRAESIANNRSLTVGGDKSETVDKEKSITVSGGHTESISGDMSLSVSKSRSMSVTDNLTESIDGSMTLNVSKDRRTSIDGDMTVQVAKDVKQDVSGNQTETIDKNWVLKAKKIQLQADDEISLKTGSASILLKKNGDITIQGKKITVKGSGDVILKGSKVAQN